MHSNTENNLSSALQGLHPVSLQNPARAFTSTQLGTPDYFWSGASLSNPIFHSPKDSHLIVLIRCWGTNSVLTVQRIDVSFWSSVTLTNLVSEQRLCLCSNEGITEERKIQNETNELKRKKTKYRSSERTKKYSTTNSLKTVLSSEKLRPK